MLATLALDNPLSRLHHHCRSTDLQPRAEELLQDLDPKASATRSVQSAGGKAVAASRRELLLFLLFLLLHAAAGPEPILRSLLPAFSAPAPLLPLRGEGGEGILLPAPVSEQTLLH